jgi:high-affinity iron transporter
MPYFFALARHISDSHFSHIIVFETLTITLREGIEAALVIGIILAYLGKTNKQALKKYVYAGIIAAVTGSIATAIAIQMLLAEWSEFMEGLMFFIAAFFLGTMLVWMHRTSKHIRQDVEQGIESALDKWQADKPASNNISG